MASEESVTILQSSSMQEEEEEEGEYDFDDDDCQESAGHPHYLSSLSMCTSNSTVYGHDGGCGGRGGTDYFHVDEGDKSDGGGHSISTFMSRLSIESFNDGDVAADGDEEFSDDHDGDDDNDKKEGKEVISGRELFSDSDKESSGYCYSLPATPPQQRNRGWGGFDQQLQKDYASENEAAQNDLLIYRRHHTIGKNTMRTRTRTRTRRRRARRLERATALRDHSYNKRIGVDQEEEAMNFDGGSGGSSGRGCGNSGLWGESCSEGGGGGGSVVIKTRPKGGRRSLCMDLEEVKACRDLGFDLELEHDHHHHHHHDRTASLLTIVPPASTRSRFSISGYSTSSSANSPINNWRISGPGDDPRDVRARIRVWAQAVALASTSPRRC